MKIADAIFALGLLAVAIYLTRKLFLAWRLGSIRFLGPSATVHRSIDPKRFWARVAWVAVQLAFVLVLLQAAIRVLFDVG